MGRDLLKTLVRFKQMYERKSVLKIIGVHREALCVSVSMSVWPEQL